MGNKGSEPQQYNIHNILPKIVYSVATRFGNFNKAPSGNTKQLKADYSIQHNEMY